MHINVFQVFGIASAELQNLDFKFSSRRCFSVFNKNAIVWKIVNHLFVWQFSIKGIIHILWYNIINIIFKVLWQLLEYAAYNTPVRCSWCSENRLRPQFHQSASSLLPQQSNSKDRRIISYNNKYHAKARKKTFKLCALIIFLHALASSLTCPVGEKPSASTSKMS